MKKIVILLLGIALTCGAQAQSTSFLKTYGNNGYDFARDIKQDRDTGYVITGSSTSFTPSDAEAYLLKLDKNGDFQWSYNYGGSATDWGESLVITHDSTYAIAGYTNSEGAGGFDFYLVRIANDGSPLWSNTYGGSDWDKAYGLIQLPDSGFVMVGESYSFNEGIRHGYIVRTDKLGAPIWEHSVIDTEPSFFNDIALDGDSIVVCGGIGDGGTDTHDGYVVKMHKDGAVGWEKRIGRAYDDYFNAVYSVGGIYSFGGVRGYNYPTHKENMWMYRMEDDGTEVIDTTYINDSPNEDGINDISIRDFDQDYYFTGYTSSFGYLVDGLSDIFMAKMTLSGVQFAQSNYGEAGNDIGQAIDQTYDGGVVVVGDTKYFSSGGNNIMVIKLNHLWAPLWDPADSEIFDIVVYDDITTGLDEDAAGNTLTVYPNPFKSTINLPQDMNSGFYQIIGLDGQLVKQGELNSNQLNLDDLDNGTYLFTVKSEDVIYKKRIIKY